MPVIIGVVGLAAVVWGVIYAHRGSLAIGCSLVLLVSYALGYQFWHARIGPMAVSLDRLLLCAVLAGAAVQWRIGRLPLRPLTANDWALAAMLLVFITSATLSGQPEITDGVTSKWGRLFAGFLLPAIMYGIMRNVPTTRREWSWLLSGFVVLGIYLAITGALELAGKWSFVFPRYIADPGLGIHFGRARGPDLNAVSLGLYLTACAACAWTLLVNAGRPWQQLVLVAAIPLIAGSVLFTFTRSTYIGLAASAATVAALEIPRRWRLPALMAGACLGLVVVAASWSHLLMLEREGSGEDAEHSVDQRTSFAYVSAKMFWDHPVLGVGFGRFYDQKLPYLSDRSQHFELESIRRLHHHNTVLSVLTETGLIGLAAFAAVFIAWARSAWSVAKYANASPWVRAQGTLMLALLVNYLCSALFHDLTLLPSQELLLFAFAGLTVNLRGEFCRATKSSHTFDRPSLPAIAVNNADSIPLFGMQISCVSMHEAVSKVLAWCNSPRGETCRFLVTPNTDHAVMFQRRADLRASYADASLVLADGAPIVAAARLLGRSLPERVAGSDLVPQLFAAAGQPLRVFLLGAAPGVAIQAARRIESQWPNVNVVGSYSPPIGFETDARENARIFDQIAAAATDLVIIGLGAPKQEVWAHLHRHQIKAKVAICAGATIDFLAGHRRRSPVWMQRAGLEWLHRVCSEPRRLAARYARDAFVLPQLFWNELRQQHTG
jgi:exopolysaccharide biosynthesis WecB/TagA/CpsF family protein